MPQAASQPDAEPTVNGNRQASGVPTVNGNRQPSRRTAAATETVKRRRTQRLALDLSERIPLLDDEWLTALAGVVLAECDARGLPVPEPDEVAEWPAISTVQS